MLQDALIKLLGLLLMATAFVVAVSKAPDRPVESLVAVWAPPPSDFVDVQGQVVHLRDEGPRADPAPIVLMHGTGASLHTWEGWVRALKTQRRVITFDLPGFGLTGPFAGRYARDDYRGDTLARFTLDLLDRLNIRRAVLGGNSLGGEVAWRVATLAPDRVERLILVDPSGPALASSSVPLGFVVARLPLINRLSEHLLPRAVVASSVANVYADPQRLRSEVVDRYFELTLREGNRRALSLRLQQMAPGEGFERIASLRQPALLLWGREDRLIPVEVAREFTTRLPGSRLVLLDRLGHVPQEEDPQRSLAPVWAFLELQGAPPA